MNEKVSLVVPIFNAGRYLCRMLDTIIMQDYSNVEVIVVNDCSTDETINILTEYDKKFSVRGYDYKIVQHNINSGICAAINSGLAVAKGEFFCFPDADDELHPHYISSMIKLLKDNSEYGWVRCNYTIVLETENREYDVFLPSKSVYKNDFYDFISKLVPHNAWNMMVRRSFFEKSVGLNIYDTRLTQEWSLLLPLSLNGDYVRCENNLYRYHIRENAMSSWQNGDIDSVIKHLNDLYALNKVILDELPLINLDKEKFSIALDIYYTLVRQKKYIENGMNELGEFEQKKLFEKCGKYVAKERYDILGDLDIYVRLVFDILLNARKEIPIETYRKCVSQLSNKYIICADSSRKQLVNCISFIFGKPHLIIEYSNDMFELIKSNDVCKACLIENSSKFKKMSDNDTENVNSYIDFRVLRDAIRGWNLIDGVD